MFDGFTAIEERSGGEKRLRTLAANGKSDIVASDEPAYAMALGKNAEPDTEWLRYEYTSLTTPDTTYEVNMATGERKLLKRMPVLGGYDLAHYVTERLWAPRSEEHTSEPQSLMRNSYAVFGLKKKHINNDHH